MTQARVLLSGTNELSSIFVGANVLIKKIISNEIKKATFETGNLARGRVPVITGRLQGSISATYNERMLKGVVGSSVKYASTIEYGPNNEYGPNDNIPGSRTGFKPYLRPSLAIAIKDIDTNISKALEKSGI